MRRGPAGPEDEQRRWAEAMAILETGGDASVQGRARKRQRIVLVTVVVVLTVIAATVGLLVATHTHGHPGSDPAVSR